MKTQTSTEQRPAASGSSENSLKMQILKLHLKLTESETGEVGHSNFMFLKSPLGESDTYPNLRL